MDNIIGIDLGGTSIKGGRIEGGRIVRQSQSDTQASLGGDVTMNVLKNVIADLKDLCGFDKKKEESLLFFVVMTMTMLVAFFFANVLRI